MKALQPPTTLKQQALIELRNSIMLGHFKPGERLVERAIAEQLNVSRTVVRECVRHLESERLITIVPNTGPIVTELNEQQIREIYQIRALMESEAVAKCAQQVSVKQAAQLITLVDRIEKQLSGAKILKTLETTTQLYAKMFAIGGLEISWDLIERLNSRINQLRIRSLSSIARQQAGPKSLRKMVTAVADKDSKAAAKACREHVQQAMLAGLEQNAKSGRAVTDEH